MISSLWLAQVTQGHSTLFEMSVIPETSCLTTYCPTEETLTL